MTDINRYKLMVSKMSISGVFTNSIKKYLII